MSSYLRVFMAVVIDINRDRIMLTLVWTAFCCIGPLLHEARSKAPYFVPKTLS